MKFPFPTWLLKTHVKVIVVDKDHLGDFSETTIYDGLSIYDEKQRQIMTADRQLVTLSGKVIIRGDIYPKKEIDGYIMIDEIKKKIYGAHRVRNPDGTIYSTELDLM